MDGPILLFLCFSQDFPDPLDPLLREKSVCSTSISLLFQVSLFARPSRSKSLTETLVKLFSETFAFLFAVA